VRGVELIVRRSVSIELTAAQAANVADLAAAAGIASMRWLSDDTDSTISGDLVAPELQDDEFVLRLGGGTESKSEHRLRLQRFSKPLERAGAGRVLAAFDARDHGGGRPHPPG